MKILNTTAFAKAMEEAGLTVKELSIKAVVLERSISGILNGTIQYPRRSTVMKLAAALGVEAESLVIDFNENALGIGEPKAEEVRNTETVAESGGTQEKLQEKSETEEIETAADKTAEELETETADEEVSVPVNPGRQQSKMIHFWIRRALTDKGTHILIRNDMLTSVRQDFKEPKIFINYETEWGGRSFMGSECFQTFEERDNRWAELMELLMQ